MWGMLGPFSVRYRVAVGLLLGAALLGCRDDQLRGSRAEIYFAPPSLSFPGTFVGATAEAELSVLSGAKSELSVEWLLEGVAFQADSLPDRVAPGSRSIRVRFTPLGLGHFEGRLAVKVKGEEVSSVALSGAGVPEPECPAAPSCQATRFDRALGRCVQAPLPDGTQCSDVDVCLEAPRCVQGRCVGAPKSCDDGNACTVDVCDAVSGCQHLEAPPCPGDGACQVGVCDPKVGCKLAVAPDGMRCGDSGTCDAADICLGGQCVTRDPPDGFVCQDATPCQDEGRCSGSVCQAPSARALEPRWTYDAAEARAELHDFVVDPDGTVTLSGFFTLPILRANTLTPFALPGPARRCMGWNSRLVCTDYPYDRSGKISALDRRTGQIQWTFDLEAARPDFVATTGSGRIFMGRMAVMGSDRVGAIFEAFPQGTSAGTACRKYFLVVLDTHGGLLNASELNAPLLEQCNHPHPFGMAADAAGNLYVGFSPSVEGPAPLVAQSPTLLISFTRDGLERWRRQEDVLGELAVADGVLYAETGARAFSAASGAPIPWTFGAVPSFGRRVVTSEHLVVSPLPGQGVVEGHSLAARQPVWAYQGAYPFTTDELRLVQWQPSGVPTPKTLALGFQRRGTTEVLVALDTRSGKEQWSCAVAAPFRSSPQLFEVTPGQLTVMDGATTCGHCDPPYAQSSAAFNTFSLPGVKPAHAPWVGTFGGAGHDHREDPVLQPPAGPSQ